MNEIENTTIVDLLKESPCLLKIFERENVDYYFKGNYRLDIIIEELKIGAKKKQNIINEITICYVQKVTSNFVVQLDNDLKNGILQIDEAFHIVKFNLEKLTKLLFDYPEKNLLKVGTEEQLTELIKFFNNELNNHYRKEETILFPLVRYLVDCKIFKEKPHLSGYKPLDKYTEIIKNEHRLLVNRSDLLWSKINQLYKPLVSLVYYRKISAQYKIFNQNLHLFVHLILNELLPQTKELLAYLETNYKKYNIMY